MSLIKRFAAADMGIVVDRLEAINLEIGQVAANLCILRLAISEDVPADEIVPPALALLETVLKRIEDRLDQLIASPPQEVAP